MKKKKEITNIVLIGMMGTSKTTTGEILSERLSMLFIDTDEMVEYEFGKIDSIFEKFGEEGFRKFESLVINRVSGFNNFVISTGGGVVLKEKNMEKLKKCATVVLLTASDNCIYKRVKDSNRPLLKNGGLAEIKRLNKERDPIYRKYADVIVDTTRGTPLTIAKKVERALLEYFSNKIQNKV